MSFKETCIVVAVILLTNLVVLLQSFLPCWAILMIIFCLAFHLLGFSFGGTLVLYFNFFYKYRKFFISVFLIEHIWYNRGFNVHVCVYANTFNVLTVVYISFVYSSCCYLFNSYNTKYFSFNLSACRSILSGRTFFLISGVLMLVYLFLKK